MNFNIHANLSVSVKHTHTDPEVHFLSGPNQNHPFQSVLTDVNLSPS